MGALLFSVFSFLSFSGSADESFRDVLARAFGNRQVVIQRLDDFGTRLDPDECAGKVKDAHARHEESHGMEWKLEWPWDDHVEESVEAIELFRAYVASGEPTEDPIESGLAGTILDFFKMHRDARSFILEMNGLLESLRVDLALLGRLIISEPNVHPENRRTYEELSNWFELSVVRVGPESQKYFVSRKFHQTDPYVYRRGTVGAPTSSHTLVGGIDPPREIPTEQITAEYIAGRDLKP